MRNVFLAIVTLLAVADRAHASSSRRGKPAPIQMEITAGVANFHVAHDRFIGRPQLDGHDVPLGFNGGQAGLTSERLADIGLRIGYATHHITFGGVAGFFYGESKHASSISFVGSDASMGGGYIGPEIGTAWSFGPVDIRLATSIGYKRVSVDLQGFDLEPCGKNGTSRCPPTAGTDALFVRPVAMLGFHHGAFAIGGYVGGDVMPDGGWMAGGYIGINGDPARPQTMWH